MTIEDLGLLVKRNVVVFSSLIFGIFVVIILYALLIEQPVYDSNIQYNALNETQSVSSYKDFINNESFQNEVKNKMVSDGYSNRGTLNQLQGVQVTATPGNAVFKVTASAKTPLLAQEYAMVLNTLFQQRFTRAFPNHHITKINGPSRPDAPSKPNLKKSIIYGLGVAVISSLIIIILKELFGKFIYSEFYVTKMLGVDSMGKVSYPQRENTADNKFEVDNND